MTEMEALRRIEYLHGDSELREAVANLGTHLETVLLIAWSHPQPSQTDIATLVEVNGVLADTFPEPERDVDDSDIEYERRNQL